MIDDNLEVPPKSDDPLIGELSRLSSDVNLGNLPFRTIERKIRRLHGAIELADPFLISRPDYRVWRMLRHFQPKLPGESSEALVGAIKECLDHKSWFVKWSMATTVANALFYVAQQDQSKWRFPPATVRELLRYLHFFIDREPAQRFAEDITDARFRAEAFLILALGRMSSCQLQDTLGFSDHLQLTIGDVVNRTLDGLREASGRTWTLGNSLTSDLLPSKHTDPGLSALGVIGYSEWLGKAFGLFGALLIRLSCETDVRSHRNYDASRLRWIGNGFLLSAVGETWTNYHAERMWAVKRGYGRLMSEKTRSQNVSATLIAFDRAARALSEQGEIAAAAISAALYLRTVDEMAIFPDVSNQQMRAIRTMKAIAKSGGCIVPAWAEADLSAVHRETTVATKSDRPNQRAARLQDAIAASKAMEIPQALADWAAKFHNITPRSRPYFAYANRIGETLRKPADNSEALSALTDIAPQVFHFLTVASYVSIAADLVRVVADLGWSPGAFLKDDIVNFASGVVRNLSHPEFVDIEARQDWQEAVRLCWATINDELRFDECLTLYSALSHVATTVLNKLPKETAHELISAFFLPGANRRDGAPSLRSAMIGVTPAIFDECTTKFSEEMGRSVAIAHLALLDERRIKLLVSTSSRMWREVHSQIEPADAPWPTVIGQFLEWRQLWVDGTTGRLLDWHAPAALLRLWGDLNHALAELGIDNAHLIIIADPLFGAIPWQRIASENESHVRTVSLAPSLRWLYDSAGRQEEPKSRGLRVEVPTSPTPSAAIDIRDEIGQLRQTDEAYSLAIVLGHGILASNADGSSIAIVRDTPIDDALDWRIFTQYRHTISLSCLTGAGRASALSDYVSAAAVMLALGSHAVCVPPCEVPYTAVRAFAHAIIEARDAGRQSVFTDLYSRATELDRAVTLWNVWGLPNERVGAEPASAISGAH